MKKNIIYASIIILAVGLVFLANGLVLAWSWPSSNPIEGNTPPPLADPTNNAGFNSGGFLDIAGGKNFWIGKNGDSFALYNDGNHRRLQVGQDGAFEISGGSETSDDVLFSIDVSGNAIVKDDFFVGNSVYIEGDIGVKAKQFIDDDDVLYKVDPNGATILNELTLDKMKKLNFNDQIGPTCMFFDGCPLGWTDMGFGGYQVKDTAVCPYQYLPEWLGGAMYWCKARVCCSP